MFHRGSEESEAWILRCKPLSPVCPPEIELVRAGNAAAGLSLGGAAIGIAIPIAATLATSHALMDVIVWGLTALVLQLVMFRLVDFVVRGLSTRIENGEMASAAVLVGVKIGAALLTASALNG